MTHAGLNKKNERIREGFPRVVYDWCFLRVSDPPIPKVMIVSRQRSFRCRAFVEWLMGWGRLLTGKCELFQRVFCRFSSVSELDMAEWEARACSVSRSLSLLFETLVGRARFSTALPAGEQREGGWTGVATLKANQHKVGPGQPVLLVEQYCQPICYTRRVFISILHVSVGHRRRSVFDGRHMCTTPVELQIRASPQ